MKTAVVILNYNGQKIMEQFLPGVIKYSIGANIVIADNCSSDNSVKWLREYYPEIQLIEMSENYGFAEGYNKALSQVDADYYVLLNSDVEIKSNWISPLLEYMNTHPECAACQPKILSHRNPEYFEHAGAAGGFIDKYGYPFCRGRILDNIEKDQGQHDEPLEIFWATGACLFIRANIYHSIGGLDSEFFAHQEEIDMCWRIKAQGHSIMCIPQSKVYHVGAATLDYESPRKTYLNFRNNAIMLYKNLPNKQYIWVFIVRIILDWAAAIQMFLTKKGPNAIAIFKAQKDFLVSKKKFKEKRFANLKKTSTFAPTGILNHMLIWQVYINKRKKFKDIAPKMLKF